jgi:hypothetical protein
MKPTNDTRKMRECASPHLERLEVTASVRRGLADAAAGRTRPARAAVERLADELGLDLKSNPA